MVWVYPKAALRCSLGKKVLILRKHKASDKPKPKPTVHDKKYATASLRGRSHIMSAT